MCGINGFAALNTSASSTSDQFWKEKLQQMNDTIIHRGPDSDGMFAKAPVGFGFRRLSILDLREEANQPMFSPNKDVVLIFNGEIYNYIEVKEVLLAKGYTFNTTSDTEVILNSYLEYGEDCVQHFNGMWAIAIYDFRKQKLFLSRDRIGIKPFYYTIQDDGFLYFSSELKALHKVCNLTRANTAKVYEYLAYGYRVNDGESFLEGVNELLPGHNLILENGQIRTQKYWQLKPNSFQHEPGLSYNESFVKTFENAVKIRYRSDVPVAILLSGGLDSSSIARVTDDLIERGELPPNDIHAFIASFPGFKDDETHIADEFIKTCKHIKLHKIQLESRNIVDELDDLVYQLDHPLFSFTSVAHNTIMRACKARGLKVVINGQGADEAYAGYGRYIAGIHLMDLLFSNPAKFMKEFNIFNKRNQFSVSLLLSQMAKTTLSPRYASYLRAKHQEKTIDTLNPQFVKESYPHYKPYYQFRPGNKNLTNYLLDGLINQGLNTILHYEDISSMNQSIEIRGPFLDYRLMEFAFSIPNQLKLDQGVTKKIIRETIGATLPDSITKNPIKIGFSTPFLDDVAKDPVFKNFVSDIFHSQSFRSKGIWNADKLANVFEDSAKFVEKPYWQKFPFWRFLNLELWARAYNITNL